MQGSPFPVRIIQEKEVYLITNNNFMGNEEGVPYSANALKSESD